MNYVCVCGLGGVFTIMRFIININKILNWTCKSYSSFFRVIDYTFILNFYFYFRIFNITKEEKNCFKNQTEKDKLYLESLGYRKKEEEEEILIELKQNKFKIKKFFI